MPTYIFICCNLKYADWLFIRYLIVAKGTNPVSTLDGKTIIRGGSTMKMYHHKLSSLEDEMDNDADNETDEEGELGSEFLSGTFTRYVKHGIVMNHIQPLLFR